MARKRATKQKRRVFKPDARFFEFLSPSGEYRRIEILSEKHLKRLKRRRGGEGYVISSLKDDANLCPKHIRNQLRVDSEVRVILDEEVCVRTFLEETGVRWAV